MTVQKHESRLLIPEKQAMHPPPSKEKPKNPREDANPLSIITFAWFVPTFIKGFKKTLDEDDLFATLPEHESGFLGDKLEEAWMKEVKKTKPSFGMTLFRVFGPKLMCYGIITVINELVLKVTQTLALGRLIHYYTPGQTDINESKAYMYAGTIICCSFLNVMFGHNYMLGLQHLGMKMRVACCSLIYRKALKMSKVALADTTTGQMINLLSNDVNRFDYAIINVHNLWVGPIQMCLIMYLVYYHVGWTGIIGICFIILFLPLQIYLGKRTSVLRLRVAIKTDERVRLMNEIITGMQVIKMYAWEKPFAMLVALVRRLEIAEIKRTSYIKGTILSFTNFMGNLALFLSIFTYTLSGGIVSAEYVFVISSFYNILRQSMTVYLPNGITQCAEALVSIRRLQNFLAVEERNPPQIAQNGINTHEIKPDGIEIKNATAKWVPSSPKNTLTNINLNVLEGQLVAIIGYVGSGKTSLLHVILQELPLLEGDLHVYGSISYASQDPWLFGGSIRDNILFGQPFKSDRYQKVTKVCALERDFSLFQHGDMTLVGERGVTLSGGQKARINLARAIYKESDVYLLDDPLAAVDTYVAKTLFEDCIMGFLGHKCVILVTNQLQFLRSVDKIYLLENGEIAGSGNYQELQESGLDFAELLDDETVEEDTKSEQENLHYEPSTLSGQEQVVARESRFSGTIGSKIYGSYFRAGGSGCFIFFLMSLFIIAQISASSCDYFLSYWTNLEQTKAVHNFTRSQEEEYISRDTTLYIYASIVIFTVFIFLTRSFIFFAFCMRSSTNLHNRMFSKIVQVPMRFYNTSSSGRILNRFSKDMGSIDEILPVVIIDTIQIGLKVMGITGVVATVNPYLLGVALVILTFFYILRKFYLATSRNVKRLEGVTRSPVFTHISSSLQGITTIRAFGAEEMLKREFDMHQNLHSSAWFMFLGSSRTFGFWLDLICVVYIACVTLSFLVMRHEQFGGNVGLAITQSIMLTGTFQWGMRQWSELENQMTSVERVVEYTKLESEEKVEQKKTTPENWPTEGKIQFKYVSLRYSPNESFVLKNLSFTIEPQEKVGIVGRTGAGKSSLISALFQLTKIEGQILIDDLDISIFSLPTVRSKISIIPQDPVLFSGTLRKNLDPFNQHSDEELWSALADVELKQLIANSPLNLNTKVSEGGTNFSVGQRQLICLARTILRKNNILILDEATANVDPKTDFLIQQTIRDKFSDCTVLTIAHRLNTVMDSDKILVMDDGEAKEFDHPYVLLKAQGIFYGMVQQTGRSMSDTLTRVAESNYNSSNKKKTN
ncbi:probable multidrug resistance-associated protein lethal(2)03659 [Onthophagus taurus]|uniref:probable multidrug resistance-associated protein lethal(2)03659 n=1 Tax=Onthophagus taurus TaxID=166361 RepID=UPI0039BE1415